MMGNMAISETVMPPGQTPVPYRHPAHSPTGQDIDTESTGDAREYCKEPTT